jgi:hypothetical protein
VEAKAPVYRVGPTDDEIMAIHVITNAFAARFDSVEGPAFYARPPYFLDRDVARAGELCIRSWRASAAGAV